MPVVAERPVNVGPVGDELDVEPPALLIDAVHDTEVTSVGAAETFQDET